MPHQCVHCSKIIEAGSREILDGCANCGNRFFFYVRDEQLKNLKNSINQEHQQIVEAPPIEKKKIEEDVRSILKIEDESQPVILDFESVKVSGPGKFEIDIVSLMNRKPIVFKLEEGKYIIDLDTIPRGK